ncbi:acyltransferase, partial [Halomonas sp. GFAJ-1]|uniref:acyltransferase n=1 Tax=Halomonas sp. GFAJ-1 TaxID=1118153 RepID=UPI00023A4BBB
KIFFVSLFKKVSGFGFSSHEFKTKSSSSGSALLDLGEGSVFNFQHNPFAKIRGNVTGKKNKIIVGSGSKVDCEVTMAGDFNKLYIDEGCKVKGRIIIRGNRQKVRVFRNTTFQNVYILCQEGCDVLIGRNCMFSRDIEIRTTDAHSVVDVQTRERVNKPASVKIGNHVWVGVGSLISKGSQIPNDSIVGAYSFVNKKFTEENVLIAGTPAKIVRHGVTWNRGRKPKFTQAQLEHWKEPPSKTE